ncbi:MAG: SusC/RagA family TonB-linked outer membrane protein [Cyclobacteriaceae bacterium]|nr:SusC/RagA family TonB-linked outer membrane protein [Cyclobacteriaceae bacterium]
MKSNFSYSVFKGSLVQVLGAVLFFVLIFQSTVQAQTTQVTGTVKDKAAGETMPGVNVAVKGTQQGTMTDAEGKYVVSIQPGATLVFSFVGYETIEIVTGNNTTINVELVETVATLDEVVMIGYGTSTKKEITGSVTTLKTKDFNGGAFTDPVGLIQGKVAGLTISQPNGADPNGGYEFILRGVNTLEAGKQPLIIIDGVIGADLKNINFQDVETFDVLKDGSAAAIYGTRGTNGVIIITTKQARSGETKLEYAAQVSVQAFPRTVENLTADEFKYAIETYAPSKMSNLLGAKTDWLDEVTRDLPVSTQHNIVLSGGTDKLSHRTSFTYLNNQGLLKDNQSKRYLLRSNLRQKVLNDRLDLDLNFTNNVRILNPANYDVFYQAFIQNPTQPVYDPTNDYAGGYSLVPGLDYRNPVAMLNERKRESKTTDLVINLRGTLKISESLSWINFVSMQKSAWEGSSYKSQYYPGSLGMNGEAEIENGRDEQNQFESNFLYQTNIGRHEFEAIAGYSFQETSTNNSYMSNAGFDSDLFEYNNIGNGSYRLNGQAGMSSYRGDGRLISLFGRVKYNFDERYMASVSLRRDGSTRFGDNHKWGLFPAVSVGWRMNEEGFMQGINSVDELKLRVGYGVTGNQDFPNYLSLLRLSSGGRFYYNGQWINTYGPSSNPNPDLRWEKKRELNVGVDFGLFNRKLSGTLDYYYRESSDLIFEYAVPTPPYLVPYMWTNVGTISNTGIELTLNGSLINKTDLKWNSTLTASHNRNKLKKISNEEFTTGTIYGAWIGGAIGVNAQRIEEGKSLGQFYGPVWLGVDEYGNDVFRNANPVGQVNEENWENIGSAYPAVVLGWSNNISYKNWNLNLLFRSNIGGKVLNSYRIYYENWTSIGLRNVVKSQLENPEFTGNAVYSSKYVESATFFKFDNITLGYTFDVPSNKYVSRVSVFGSAQNVLWITGYKGLDPEVRLGGLFPGVESLGYYPRTTTLTIGLNATF